jgi:hypothetical protein
VNSDLLKVPELDINNQRKLHLEKIEEIKGGGNLPWCTTGFVPGPFKKTSAGADSTPNLIRNR